MEKKDRGIEGIFMSFNTSSIDVDSLLSEAIPDGGYNDDMLREGNEGIGYLSNYAFESLPALTYDYMMESVAQQGLGDHPQAQAVLENPLVTGSVMVSVLDGIAYFQHMISITSDTFINSDIQKAKDEGLFDSDPKETDWKYKKYLIQGYNFCFMARQALRKTIQEKEANGELSDKAGFMHKYILEYNNPPIIKSVMTPISIQVLAPSDEKGGFTSIQLLQFNPGYCWVGSLNRGDKRFKYTSPIKTTFDLPLSDIYLQKQIELGINPSEILKPEEMGEILPDITDTFGCEFFHACQAVYQGYEMNTDDSNVDAHQIMTNNPIMGSPSSNSVH